MKNKLIFLISLLLIISGITLVVSTLINTFNRVPPDKKPPLLFLNIEDLSSGIFFKPNSTDKQTEKFPNSDEELKAGEFKLQPIFLLRIPAIDLREVVYEGTSRRALMSGPGHLKGSAMPGEKGNCVISGHRVTFGGPFRRLNDLKVGDLIYIVYRKKEYIYAVRWKRRVKPNAVWVAAPTSTPSVTLTTCDPPFSARYRLVVRGEFIGTK